MTHDPDPLLTLMDGPVSGRYLVQTKTGSQYMLDLDLGLVIRERSDETRELRRDSSLVLLEEIGDATVGRPMVLLLNLGLESGSLTIRRTSPVVSITRIESLDRGGAV